MTDYLNDPPADWRPDYSKYRNITSYEGKLLTPVDNPSRDLAKLWEKFTADMKAENERRQGCDVRAFSSSWVSKQAEQQLREGER